MGETNECNFSEMLKEKPGRQLIRFFVLQLLLRVQQKKYTFYINFYKKNTGILHVNFF